jgi:hypothetical protein
MKNAKRYCVSEMCYMIVGLVLALSMAITTIKYDEHEV